MGHGLSSWSKYRFMAPATEDIPLGQVWMMGSYGGAPVLVALDSAGRIIMVPYGVTTIDGTATVTQAEKDREVQGKDGVTLRTLAVDASGQLIMVPRGQSGTYMDVDASGFLSTIMKGLDGVTLRTVAVDANGKILGVLQGDYAGTLKTLAVDSQGRMLAVLTDPEDVFGNPTYMGAAELAARLGSIVTHDRRGQVLFMDGFEHGLSKWNLGSQVTTGTHVPVVDTARSGGVSCRIRPGVGAGGKVYIEHMSPYPILSKMGLEFSVAFAEDSNIFYALFEARGEESGVRGGLRFTIATGLLEYYNESGAWATLDTGVVLYPDPRLFHTLKVVLDIELELYARAIVDNHTYTMAGLLPYELAGVPQPYTILDLYQEGLATAINYLWVDDVILTQNEP